MSKPTAWSSRMTLAVNEVETACDVSIAMEAARDYGLSARDAGDVLKQVQEAVAGWREEATRLNILRQNKI